MLGSIGLGGSKNAQLSKFFPFLEKFTVLGEDVTQKNL